MRNPLLYLILVSACFSPLFSTAQCVNCFSMEEALKSPGEVTYLNLRDQQLHSLPAEMVLFTNLETLDLSYNQLVDLSSSNPVNPKLKTLKINNNYGLDIVDLLEYCAKLENLTTLEVSRCGIPFLPETIADLKQLKNLDLSGNSLITLPSAVEHLAILETLDLSYNKLKEIVYVGSSFWNLKKLNVSNNEKMDLTPLLTGISFLSSLEELILSAEESEMSFPNAIGMLTVPRIVIRNTQIKKLNPAFMKNKELKELIFENCDIYNEAQVLNLLKGMRKLESLGFLYTDCFTKISDLKQLKQLSISQNGALPLEQLTKMDQLKTLDLRLQKMEESEKEQLKAALPKTDLLFRLRDFEEGMSSNNVTPIVELQPVEKIISATEPTQLIFEKTMLDIPASAFLNQDGSTYSGKVSVQMTEIFDPVSMALSGAPMVFGEGNDTQLFGSNGMFEIRAKDQAGKDLQPNPSVPIQVSIQNVQPDVQGQLFVFDSITRQWQTVGVPRQVNIDSLVQLFTDSINRVDDMNLVSYIDIPIIVKVKMKRKITEPSLLNFTFNSNKSLIPEGKETYYKKLYLPNNAQRQITKHQWKIDSTVTLETRDLFREIARKQKKMDKKRRRNKVVYDNYPRYVKNIEITPDFDKDHFVMTFSYKDSLIKVPVYIHNGGNTKSLIEQQNRFFNRYNEKIKADNKFNAKIQRKRAAKLKVYAESKRNELIASYRANVMRSTIMRGTGSAIFSSKEQLRFGLTNFGLVNCDYFARNIPDVYFAFDQPLQDDKGALIKVPNALRVLLFNTNSYLQTSSMAVPYYIGNRSLIIFEYEKDKLAVVNVTRSQDNNFTFKTRSIEIAGMDPNAIQKSILEN